MNVQIRPMNDEGLDGISIVHGTHCEALDRNCVQKSLVRHGGGSNEFFVGGRSEDAHIASRVQEVKK